MGDARARAFATAKEKFAEKLLARIARAQEVQQRLEARLASLPHDTWTNFDVLNILGRKRDRHFVSEFMIAVTDGSTPQEAGVLAAQRVWRSTSRSEKRAMKKAREKLGQPAICEAIEILFETAGGFSLNEALQLQVKHIRGELTREQTVNTAAGVEVRSVRIPPNYSALKDYFGLTLPKPATKVETKNLHVLEDGKQIRDELRAMQNESAPRFVGQVVESSGSDEHEFDEDELRALATGTTDDETLSDDDDQEDEECDD